ncbi:MAG: hypothetical protein GY769_23120 [bacterium]|nr:hypothetical protein [bacterium]
MAALLVWGCAHAPASPEAETEVDPPRAPDSFLVEFDTRASTWRVTEVQRVTDRDAYDNQPYFEADGGGFLFASARDGQTDIFRYRIGSDDIERLTETAESEYSPTPITGWPGFSTVRVEADGTQRLWRFPAKGAGRQPEVIFHEIAPVGYHAWIDPDSVAMFLLGEPNELVIGELLSQEGRTVSTGIGRALHSVPSRNAVSFVDKSDPEHWTITILDLDSGGSQKIVETPSGSEDFVWWSDHEILIGQGSKLYVFDVGIGDDWREVADLSEAGVRGLTRLSPSPHGDRLAVVGERAED